MALACAFALLCLSVALFAPARVAHAADVSDDDRVYVDLGAIDQSRKGSITVAFATTTGDALPDVPVKLYQVAELKAGFPLLGDFAASGIAWETESGTPAYADAAVALAAYAASEGAATAGQTSSDAAGNAAFANLPTGIYLFVADTTVGPDNRRYYFDAGLVTVPIYSADEGFVYDVVAEPKFRSEAVPITPDKANYKVSKQWQGDTGAEKGRPSSVTVKLCRDNDRATITTITLNDANNWCHEWQDDEGHSWSVTEVGLQDGYVWNVTSQISDNNTSFVITNTTNTAPPVTVRATTSRFAKTGDRLWPIIPLLCIGVFGIGLGTVGAVKRRKGQDDGAQGGTV